MHPDSKEREVWAMHGFFLLLTMFSFRHVWIRGDHVWTGEGSRLSWSMRLSGKYCDVQVKARPEDPWSLPDLKGLTPIQRYTLSDPDLFLQYVQAAYCQHGGQIYGSIECRAVDHQMSPLIHPEVDLCRVSYKLWSHNEWIFPFPGEKDPHYLEWLKQKELHREK